jgi:hypothetical protein
MSGLNRIMYDVVEDVLQKHYDKLWKMTKDNNEWGVMDHIRLEQMVEIEDAIVLWKDRHKFADFSRRITEYLFVGGFFNPEMMEHDKVRDLLIQIRDLFIKHE